MPETAQPGVHRPSRTLWVITLATLLGFLGLALIPALLPSPLWQRVAVGILVLLSVVAIVELSQRRIVLHDDALELVSGFRRRSLPRSEIASVTWAKGAGASVQLADGTWVRLPDMGPGPQGLTNSVRAWLKRTSERISDRAAR